MIIGVPTREPSRGTARGARAGGDSHAPQSGPGSRPRGRRRRGGRLSGRGLRREGREDRAQAGRCVQGRRRHHAGARRRRQRQDRRGGSAAPSSRPEPDRLSPTLRGDRDAPEARRHRRDVVLHRAHAPDDACAEHGCALVHGDDLRLQGRDDRGRHAAAALSDADDRGGHDHARARLRHRGRRRRASGHRDGAAPRRRRVGLRSAPGREGAGAEPRRPVHRAAPRSHGRAGLARIRPRAGRGLLSAPAGTARACRGRERRGHCDGRGAGNKVARARHARDGRDDGARFGDRRSGGRAGWQLRAHAGGRGRGGARRHNQRHRQPGEHGAVPRQPDVRAKRQRVSAPSVQGRGPQPRSRRPDCRRDVVDPGRRSGQPARAGVLFAPAAGRDRPSA